MLPLPRRDQTDAHHSPTMLFIGKPATCLQNAYMFTKCLHVYKILTDDLRTAYIQLTHDLHTAYTFDLHMSHIGLTPDLNKTYRRLTHDLHKDIYMTYK